MNLTARFSRTMPSDAAKNASTCVMKCFSSPANRNQQRHYCLQSVLSIWLYYLDKPQARMHAMLLRGSSNMVACLLIVPSPWRPETSQPLPHSKSSQLLSCTFRTPQDSCTVKVGCLSCCGAGAVNQVVYVATPHLIGYIVKRSSSSRSKGSACCCRSSAIVASESAESDSCTLGGEMDASACAEVCVAASAA